MKKNVMMRIAAFMLVAVLISTSAISGTYAKYVTSDKSDDAARVAAFGVTVAADFSNLFKSQYASTTNHADDSDGVTVKTIFGGDLVAPGTDGSLVDFAVAGTPEVDVRVTYAPKLTMSNWVINGSEAYCPIIITVKTGDAEAKDYYIGGKFMDGTTPIIDVATLIEAVEEAITKCEAYYNAGTNLADVVKNDLEVSWRWEFEGEKDSATLKGYQLDVKDTALGNWILSSSDPASAGQIALEITCTITQVD